MSEADILAVPPAVVAEVARLDAALDGVIPVKAPNENIVIGTWNLRAFADLTKAWETPAGASPVRNFADVTYIATFIRRCDVVAVQEVRGNLRALRHLLRVLGDDWGFILTDVAPGPAGNDERLAFLFDTQRVKPSGLACELVVWVETGSRVAAVRSTASSRAHLMPLASSHRDRRSSSSPCTSTMANNLATASRS